MELELGLKVTRTREDVSSSVDFRFSKDPFGPLVLSQETDSRFIIIIHLKGFKKEGIEIEINKEGDRITIRGRKPVEEMVVIGWMAWRKEVEMREFKKVFMVPDVVDLDKIKARFDDDDATLTITMPKRVKGISGFNLEQEEEEESGVENREAEEDNEERDESDEHYEAQKEEEFGEMMADKERESQVFEGEEEGFSEGVDEDEPQVENKDFENIQEIDDEQHKVLGFAEEETVGQQELADSDIESEDSGLKKLPDIKEQEDKNQEVMKQRFSEETKSDDNGYGAVEETGEQESYEDSGSNTKSEDSGLTKLPDIIEQEEGQEVTEQKVSEETKSDDIGSEAVEEQGSHGDSGLEKLPGMIEQEDNQEVMDQKVSEETKSDDTGSGAVEEIEEQESHEDSGLEKLPDIIEQKDNQDVMEHEVSEESKSDDIGSGEVEEKESDEIGRTNKSREMEKKKTDGTDGGLRKAQGIEEPERDNKESKIQDMVEEETGGQEKIKPPDIIQQEKKQDVMEQKDSQKDTRSDGFRSRGALEEFEKQEPCEQIDGTSKSRAKADDDGLRNVQGTEEPERRNEVRKIQEIVKGETSDHEKIKNVNMETKIKDPKEDVDEEMGEGFTPVAADDNTAEIETKAESIKQEADKVDKKHELVEKKEEQEENTKVIKESEDRRSLTKFEENEEQRSKRPKRQDKKENVKELVKEKAPEEAVTSIEKDVVKPVQETEASEVDTVVKTDDEGKENKKKSVKMESAPKIAETETKPEDIESEKLGGDEADKKHKLVEKKEEEEANVRAEGEDRSLLKFHEDEEQQEIIKELVEEKTPERDMAKPVQEIEVPEVGTLGEISDGGIQGKEKKKSVADTVETETKPEDFESDKLEADEVDKIHKLVEKKQKEDAKNDEVGTQSKGISSIKPQGVGGHESQGQKQHGKDEKIKELVEDEAAEAGTTIENDTPKPVQEETNDDVSRKTNDEEKEKKRVEQTETKEKESCRPKVLGEQEEEEEEEEEEKVQEIADEKTDFPKNRKVKEEEKVSEKKTELSDDDNSRTDAKEGVDAEMGKGFEQSIAETETKHGDFESEKLGEDKVEKIHKQVEKKEEEAADMRAKDEDRSLVKLQEDEEPHSEKRKGKEKQESIKEMVDEKAPEEETNVANDVHQEIEQEVSTSGETGVEAKEKKKSESLDAKEEVGVKLGVPNTAETETKPEEFVSDQLKADELDNKIHELVEKEEGTNAKVGTQSEDMSLIKPQKVREEQSQGQKQHKKIKELVEEKTPEEEKNKENDTLKPAQERCEEGKQKIPKLFQEETKKKQSEEYKEKMVETVKKIDDAGSRKVQEMIRQQDLDEPERCEKEIAEKKTEFDDDDDDHHHQISRRIGDTEERASDSKEEADSEMDKGLKPNTAETEKKPEELESDEIHELVEKKEEEEDNAKVRGQREDSSNLSKKLHETKEQQFHQAQKRDNKQDKIKELVEEKTPIISETEKKAEELESDTHELFEKKKKEENDKVRREGEDTNLKRLQEEKSQGPNRQNKQEKTRDLVEEKPGQETERPDHVSTLETCEDNKVFAETETKDQESYRPKILEGGEDTVQELAEDKMDFITEEEIAEKKTELGHDDARKGQEEKVSDGAKAKADNDKSRKAQETDKRQPQEEDKRGIQPLKLIEGETSGHGEAEDEKKTTEAQENESRDSDVSGKYGKEDDVFEPKRDHVSTDSEVEEARRGGGGLSKIKELHDPNIHKKRDKTNGTEVPSGHEKSVESMAIDKSRKVQEIDEQQPHEEDKRGNQFQRLVGGETSGQGEVEDVESDEKKTREVDKRVREAQEIERTDSDDVSGKYGKGETFQELQEEDDIPERGTDVMEQEVVNLNNQIEQENVEKSQELEGENINNCKEEEESETRTDDVIRKVQGTKEQELCEPERDHVSKIKEVMEEKTAEGEVESEPGGLSEVQGSEEEESHEPNIHKERYKTRITGTEEPSGQEKEEEVKEKVVEFMTVTEKESSPNAQEIKDQRPDKERHEKQYNIQDLVEAGHNETEEDTSKKVEQQESGGLKRSVVQDKKQETEEKKIDRAMEEKEILEMRKKTEDVGLRKDQDGEDPGLSKPYMRQEEDKVHEPVKMGTSDYKEKNKNDISRSQEPGKPDLDELDRQGEQTKIPQGEDMIQEPVELRTHDYSEKVEQQESGGLKRSVVEDKKRETEEKEINRAMMEKEIVERRKKTEDVSLRKDQDDGDTYMSKPYKRQEEDKTQEPVEMGTSNYREKTKNDISRSQEPGKPNLDELERHGKQTNIPKGEGKIQEPVEMRTHGYIEKDKKQDRDVEEEEEEVEYMAEKEGNVEDNSSDKFHEIEEQKSPEDWTHETPEKRKDFCKEEETDPKESVEQEKTRALEEKEIAEERTKTRDGNLRKVQDDEDPELSKPYKSQEEDKVHESMEKRTSDYREEVKKQDGDNTLRSKEEATGPEAKRAAEAGREDDKEEQEEENVIAKTELKAEEDTSEKAQEAEKQKSDDSQRSLAQDKMKETEEKEETRAKEKNETVERRTKTEDGNLREVEDGKKAESSKPYNEDKIKELVKMVKEQEGDDILRSQETEKLDLVEEEEETVLRDEHTGEKGEPEEEVAQTKTKVEDKINKEVEENQKEEKEEEYSLDDPMTKTRESEKEESEIHEKLDIVQEETRDQEETATVEGNYSEDSSRILQTIEEQRNDPRLEERIAEKETKEKEAFDLKHTGGKGDNHHKEEEKFIPKVKAEEDISEQEFDELQRSLVQDKRQETEEEKGKARTMEEIETVEGSTKTEDGGLRKVQEGEDRELSRDKRQNIEETEKEESEEESNENKDPEPGGNIEEIDASNHELNLETDENSLIKDQECLEKETSKRRPVGQENIQQLMGVEKREDDEKSEAETKTNAGKPRKLEMQENEELKKIQKPMEEKEKGMEDKILEPNMEGTKDQREEDREDEEMKRESEDVSTRKVQKIKEEETDGLEKHMELSEIQEGGYKAVLKKTKSVEDSSQSKDVAEKRSDKTGEQNEKAQRITQVDSMANDGSSNKNETERLKRQKQKEDHQELVEMETSDQRKEEREEKIVGEAVTRDECDSSRKNQEHEEESDKLEEMSGSVAKEETSNDKEENRGNRAGEETTIKDDKKQLVLEKGTSGEPKENRNQETKSRDESSRENEKQESHEQKRHYEEQEKGSELVKQRSTDNLKDEETKIKDKESSKTSQQLIETGTGEEERRKEQGRIKELEEDTTHSCRETECEDGSSKKIDKEESTEPGRYEKRDKIQPVDSETSEDDSEEELEVEVEESEEDWEAEVIQEMDSDEDNDKLRKIRRFKLGFRLVGGSTLFMSLIVIVIRLIRSKRKIRCYKF